MARYNYYNIGDHYSEWHRQHDGISMIDIDSVEVCKKCGCPLLLIEHSVYKGHDNKQVWMLQKLANMAGVQAWLLFVKLKDGGVVGFRGRVVAPTEWSSCVDLTTGEWLYYLRVVHEHHDKICGG
jgi:hypothetical protein